MFIKLTKSGPRQYLQLVEAFRDDSGRPKQRTVATLGRLDLLGDSLQPMRDGLTRLLGEHESTDINADPCNGTPEFESSRALGDLWALNSIWKQLGLDQLRQTLRQHTRHQIDIEALLRLMVINRLCDADTKLGLLRWVQTVSLPESDLKAVSHQHLLRTMDALIDHQSVIEDAVADAVRPMVNAELSVVFYDMTTIRASGLSEQDDDARKYGMSKEGGIARQFMLGLVQTAEGIPLYHEVFNGNTAEVGTLKDSLQKVMARFPIQRVIAVADRGLLSLGNLEELQAMTTPGGQPLEFILAVPGRRYHEFVDLLEPINSQAAAMAKTVTTDSTATRAATSPPATPTNETPELVDEAQWQGLRLVIAHNPYRANEQNQARDKQIAALETQAAQWVGKLDGQDGGQRSRGRSLSDGGVRARFYHAVSEAHLRRIIKVDLKSELFTYDIDEKALALARAMDGKLLLVTNVKDLRPEDVVARYKSLADIERGFKVLKSDIEIGPVHHRLPNRIRAHAMICFVALVIQRVMRAKLKAQPVKDVVSPDRALSILRRIQTHRVVLNGSKPISGISTINPEQLAILESLGVKKPTHTTRYINL
jgi:transposase